MGTIMPAPAYAVISGAAFDIPVHPGPLPNVAGLTGPQITAVTRQYDTNLDEFTTFVSMQSDLRRQILSAVDHVYLTALKHPTIGYANVSPRQFLDHLTTKYGGVTSTDMEANRAKLATQWNPDEPVENLWERITEIRNVATAGGDPISDTATIELTLQGLAKCGVFDRAIQTWFDKPLAERTWVAFQDHFERAYENREREKTAKASGFACVPTHSANQPPPVVTPPTAPGANAGTNEDAKPNAQRRLVYNDTPLSYCWTHGLVRNASHTSATCTNRADGHDETATLFNRKGGCNEIRCGRSGKRPHSPNE
ncbi:hypothetical protein [Marinobacter shengliensis]